MRKKILSLLSLFGMMLVVFFAAVIILSAKTPQRTELDKNLNNRVTTDLQLLYTFEEGSGNTVFDISGVGTPINLTINTPEAVMWAPDGLAVISDANILSDIAATRLADAVINTNEITIEAWIKPENLTQEGPARIFTMSEGGGSRNFTLGQALSGPTSSDLAEFRLRTTTTGINGIPAISTPQGTLDTIPKHIIYTRDRFNDVNIYIDGELVKSGTVTGDLSNWSRDFKIAIANEINALRPWKGEFYLLAIYNRALSKSEVMINSGVEIQPPKIVLQPQDQRVMVGETTAFTIAASGEEPLRYQWQKNEMSFAPDPYIEMLENRSMEDDNVWLSKNGPLINQRSDIRARTGIYSRHIVTNNEHAGLMQLFPITSGQKFIVSAWVYLEPGSDPVQIDLTDTHFGESTYLMTTITGEWVYLEMEAEAIANSADSPFYVRSFGFNTDYYVDDVSVRRINEHIYNGDMELDLFWDNKNTPVLNEQSDLMAHTGQFSRHVVTDSKEDGIQQTFYKALEGMSFLISAWVYLVPGSGTVHLDVADLHFGPDANAETTTTGEWVKLEFEATALYNVGGAPIYVRSVDPRADFYVDDVSVKEIRNTSANSPVYITNELTLEDNGSTFRCIVSNDYGADTSDVALLEVLSGVNLAPVVAGLPDTVKISADSSQTLNFWNYVVDDLTADTLLQFDFTVPENTLVLSFNNATGNLDISAAPGFSGLVNLDFTVSDGEFATPGTIPVEVISGSNLAPVLAALPDSVMFRADTSFSLNIWEYVEDDFTPDSLLIFNFTVPQNTLVLNFDKTTGILDIAGINDFNGSVIVDFTVSDGEFSTPGTLLVVVDPVTGINEKDEALPGEFNISQNYPNPFNPSTNISYSVPEISNVRIVVFDILGQKVEELVNKVHSAGIHKISWNAGAVAAGIYLYTIEASALDGSAEYKSIRKMILLK